MTLVVFDLVGTLADASPRYAYAFSQVCTRYGITPPSSEEVLSRLGNRNLKQIISEFAGDLPENKVPEFMVSCNSQCDSLLHAEGWEERLHDHVRSMLHSFAAEGVSLGIYTGIREDALSSLLEYHDLEDLFDPSYIRGKDNERDGFIDSNRLKAQQLLSIRTAYAAQNPDSRQIIVVGDSEADLQASRANGLHFIGFAVSDKKSDMFRKSGADQVIRDFRELPEGVAYLEQYAHLQEPRQEWH